MIIQESEIVRYLRNNDLKITGLSTKVLEKLVDWRNREVTDSPISIVDYLFLAHQFYRKSLRMLAKEIDVSKGLISKIFDNCSLPKMTKSEAVRLNWQDPEFRKRNAEAVRLNWQDPEFRERHAEAVREARTTPENISRYKLPTIQGFRKGLEIYCQSCWEANIARVLLFTGREFSAHQPLKLRVNEEYRELFNSEITETQIDFVTRDNRGNVVFYEIMSSPLEKEIDWAKIEMTIEQYPFRYGIITPRFYRKLERRFKDRINSSEFLAGWEDEKSNLRTEPEKYGVVEQK